MPKLKLALSDWEREATELVAKLEGQSAEAFAARALRAPLPSQPEPSRADVLRFPGAPAAPAQPLPQSWRNFLRRIFRRREAARP